MECPYTSPLGDTRHFHNGISLLKVGPGTCCIYIEEVKVGSCKYFFNREENPRIYILPEFENYKDILIEKILECYRLNKEWDDLCRKQEQKRKQEKIEEWVKQQ